MTDFDKPPPAMPAHAEADDVPAASAAADPTQGSAEQRLRASQAFLHQALAVGLIGTWYVDLLTGAQWWSPETYQLFGVEPGTPNPIESF